MHYIPGTKEKGTNSLGKTCSINCQRFCLLHQQQRTIGANCKEGVKR